MFGARVALAERYALLLAGAGVERGLIGPREAPRIWDRHLLNCALLAEALEPAGGKVSVDTVADLGSGAGLPGVVLALCRPQLTVTLVEPLERRVRFLEEAVEVLGLDGVEVVRARAEDLHGRRRFDVVTARAVAPLARLAGWALPLARPGGVVLAMKGASAEDEVARDARKVHRLGATAVAVERYGADWASVPTTVVRMSTA